MPKLSMKPFVLLTIWAALASTREINDLVNPFEPETRTELVAAGSSTAKPQGKDGGAATDSRKTGAAHLGDHHPRAATALWLP